MFILRQLNSSTLYGADAVESLTIDQRQQIVDMNPRYIMALAGDGQFTSDYTQVAGSGSTFVVPLPQNYTAGQMLHLCLTSDQTIMVTTTGGIGTQKTMIYAGTSSLGVLTQCGIITALTITNPSAVAANIEWFMFQLPNVLVNAGWRDGSLATGLISP
jgi:hypothetical protein